MDKKFTLRTSLSILATIKFILVIILSLGINLQTSFAQVVYQNNVTVSTQPSSSGNTISIPSFTIPIGTKVLLVIGTRIASSTIDINNINYNGVDYTSNQIQQEINTFGNHSVWAIPLGDVSTQITGDITITMSASSNSRGAIATSFSNVDQSTPIDGSVSNKPADGSTSSSVSVATSNGNMAVDFIGAYDSPTFVEGNLQTGLGVNTPINSNGANRLSMSIESATGATTSMDWTMNQGKDIVHLGNNIIAHSDITDRVAYQNNVTVSTQPSNNSGSTISIPSFTIKTGSNVLLVIGTRIGSNSININNINYNGVDYTLNQIQQESNSGGIQSVWAIPFGDVSTQITGDITITMSGSSYSRGAIATSFYNVDQSTPMDGSVSNEPANGSTSSSVSVATSNGNMAVDFIGAYSSPTFVEGNLQTGLGVNTPINSNGANRLSMSIESATGATTSMDWTMNQGGGIVHLGNNLVFKSAILPVELTQFEATPKNEIVELIWQTASELNNMGFEIERSSDGTDWKMINFVDGNGSTNTSQFYSFMDSRPLAGYNYYRLKQIDFDGKFEYSDIRTVLIDDVAQADLQVFPNPNNGQFTLSLFKPQYSAASIRVYGTEGNLVWQEHVSSSEELTHWKKDLDLPRGKIYHVVTYVDGEVLTQKIISMNKR